MPDEIDSYQKVIGRKRSSVAVVQIVLEVVLSVLDEDGDSMANEPVKIALAKMTPEEFDRARQEIVKLREKVMAG